MVQLNLDQWQAPIEFIDRFNGVELWIKRDDSMHEIVSGNKLYKLYKNFEEMQIHGKSHLLTFGGAFSNHIAATAQLAHDLDVRCIGIIRGESSARRNPTLSRAKKLGMEIQFISRTEYRNKSDQDFLTQLRKVYDDPYIIPEGGANRAGIQGAQAMLDDRTKAYDCIATAVGTGTTLAGLSLAAGPQQQLLGLIIHKHLGVMDDVTLAYPEVAQTAARVTMEPAHFGGYAKWNSELLEFIRSFHSQYGIKLDPIYTAKALMRLITLCQTGVFESGTRLLFLHTGGLQGIAGFEERIGHSLF